MQALHLVTATEPMNVEQKLARMDVLRDSIKELTAEFDQLKKQVINEHFLTSDTYMTAKGLILATYKEQIRTQFKTTEFKKDHFSLYEDYCDLIPVKTFLLK